MAFIYSQSRNQGEEVNFQGVLSVYNETRLFTEVARMFFVGQGPNSIFTNSSGKKWSPWLEDKQPLLEIMFDQILRNFKLSVFEEHLMPSIKHPVTQHILLLQPAVSVGNVGQLAIDLVISTLDMTKVGYFYTDCLVPMVGNNPYATAEENSTELSINAEGEC